MKEQENSIYWIILIFSIAIIGSFSFFFSLDYSSIWVYKHIGIDSHQFVGNLHVIHNMNYQNLNYTVNSGANLNAIEYLEEQIQPYEKRSMIFLVLMIVGYLAILGVTIFTYFRNTMMEYYFNKDYESYYMSVVGIFLGVCFGLSSGSYLLLISLRKEYFFQLLVLITQNIPYERLPFIEWDASYQILCVSYIGFGIISILLFSSLLLHIGYFKSMRKEFKHGSYAYLISAIPIFIEIFYIFSRLDHFW